MYGWKITLITGDVIWDYDSKFVEIDDDNNLVLFNLRGIWPFRHHVGGSFIASGRWVSIEELEKECDEKERDE